MVAADYKNTKARRVYAAAGFTTNDLSNDNLGIPKLLLSNITPTQTKRK